MKNLLLAVFICCLSFGIKAQPVIYNAEGYTIGNVIHLGSCPPIGAGPAGAAQTWNFFSLVVSEVVSLKILPVASSSIYQSASFLEKYSDGLNYYMRKTASQSHIVGMIDSSVAGGNDSVTYNDNVLAVARPFGYGSVASDNFTLHTIYSGSSGPVSGTGTISLTGDAYGTLVLPNGTYENVLRIKTNEQATYKLGSGGTIVQTIHSYKWFNNVSTAPLLRIDSLVATYYPKSGINVTSSEIKVRYLVSGNLVHAPLIENDRSVALRANIAHNELTLFGSFSHGEEYEVTVCDFLGRKVFNSSFVAAGDLQKFGLANELGPGVYIVSLLQKNEPESRETVRIVK